MINSISHVNFTNQIIKKIEKNEISELRPYRYKIRMRLKLTIKADERCDNDAVVAAAQVNDTGRVAFWNGEESGDELYVEGGSV